MRAVPAPELAVLAAGDGTGGRCALFCRKLRGVGSIAPSMLGRPARLPWSRRYEELLPQGTQGQAVMCPAQGTEASKSSPNPQQNEPWGHGHGSDGWKGTWQGSARGCVCTCSGMGALG